VRAKRYVHDGDQKRRRPDQCLAAAVVVDASAGLNRMPVYCISSHV
jgi:hypothetical protein